MKIKAIVYLPLNPQKAKEHNLPVKLPILLEDFPTVVDEDKIPLDVILRGLEAQYEVSKDDYYASYLVYFYYEKFKELVNKEEYEKALEVLEKARRIIYDYRYHFYKGILLKKIGKLGEAEVELRISLSQNENFPLGFYELGEILANKGEIEEAIESYHKAYESDKNFLLPLLRIGELYRETGDLISAVNIFESILKKDEEFVEAYYQLGLTLNELQKFDKAAEILEKALKKQDRDDTKLALAYSLVKVGKFFRALKILDELRKKKGDDPIILTEYGILARDIGLYEDALESLERAFNISREDEIVRYNYGRILLHFDRKKAFEILSSLTGDLAVKANDLLNLIELAENASVERGSALRKAQEIFKDDLELLDEFIDDGIFLINEFLHLIEEEELFQERFKFLREGEIPFFESDINSSDYLDILYSMMLKVGFDPIALEENVTRFAVSVYGNGLMLAAARTLLRLYQTLLYTGEFDVERFLESVVPEMQDLHWKFALSLSRYHDKETFDPSKGDDFVISIVRKFAVGDVNVERDDWKRIVKSLKELEVR